MTKFDYKKWIVENKYGKNNPHYGSLNEQTEFSCPEGSSQNTTNTVCDNNSDVFGMIYMGSQGYQQATTSEWIEQCCTGSADSFSCPEGTTQGPAYQCEPDGYVTNQGEEVWLENCCTGSLDGVEDFADNEWDPNLEGCGNFDNLPNEIQLLACEAYANLGDTNNPSLTMWVQGGSCCQTGSMDTGSMAQGMPSRPGSRPKFRKEPTGSIDLGGDGWERPQSRRLTEDPLPPGYDKAFMDGFCQAEYGPVYGGQWEYLEDSFTCEGTYGTSTANCSIVCKQKSGGMPLQTSFNTGDLVDFDQSFYDTWQGDYGHHPGHGITPDKTISGKGMPSKGRLREIKKSIQKTINRIKKRK